MGNDSYGFAARFYDVIFKPVNAGLRGIGRKIHPPRPGMTVLDLGCGTGLQLEEYQQRGCKVCGVDASAAMLHQARQRLGKDAELHLSDATRAPLARRTFDLVLLTLFLHEVPAPIRDALLEQAKRVLAPDGRILVIDFHPGAPDLTPKGWLTQALITITEMAAGREHFANQRDFVARGGIPGLAARHGLVFDEQQVVGDGNMGIYLMRRA